MADQEITELTELTEITGDDLFVIENDPLGTPDTRKAKATTVGRWFVRTQMDGMRLIWNSVNSLSVGVGACYAENNNFIDVTTTLTASSLSLSVSSWYHIYIYLSGGAAAMEVVTTAPVAWKGTAYSKTGDTSRRYVGSVKTDSSGNIYKFTHNPQTGKITYTNLALNATPFRCLTTGTATSVTSVSLAGVVPVTSTLANIRMVNTSDVTYYIGDSALTTSLFSGVLVAGNVVQTTIVFDVQTTTAQLIYYRMASTPGTGGGNIDVYGYYFDR